MLIIPAPSKAEVAGLEVQGEPGLQSLNKEGRGSGRSSRMLPLEEINVVFK